MYLKIWGVIYLDVVEGPGFLDAIVVLLRGRASWMLLLGVVLHDVEGVVLHDVEGVVLDVEGLVLDDVEGLVLRLSVFHNTQARANQGG